MGGEPKADFKGLVKDRILKQKQAAEDKIYERKKAERERKKIVDQKRKEQQEKQKAVLEAKAKAAEEAKKKKEEAEAAKKEGEAKKDGEEEKKDDEKKDEEKKEEPKEEKKAEEKKEEEKKEEEKKDEEVKEVEEEELVPPVAKLTEEEEKTWFFPHNTKDLRRFEFNTVYTKFALPDKNEGFDEIKYEWQDAKKSQEYLRKMILEKKRTSRIEDLRPGADFRTKLGEWHKQMKDWQAKQAEGLPKVKPKSQDDDDDSGEVDVKAVTDVADVGGGIPLFVHFGPEDWALLQLRWELHTLAKSYKKDVNDEDRTEIPEEHIPFYSNTYFNQYIMPANYGKENWTDLCTLVADTVKIADGKLSIAASEDADSSTFVKVTEEKRRERQRRIDAGDETARLKLQAQVTRRFGMAQHHSAPRKEAQAAPKKA